LFASIDTAVLLKPTHLLHGHESLTTIFDSPQVLAQVKRHLQWLYQATLESIRQGPERAAIHHLNLIPPGILETAAAQVPYLVMREHFIDRVYDQNVGYWQPGLAGLDQLSTKELGSVFSYYLGLSDQQIASAAEKMLANGDLELAGKTVNQALSQYPDSQPLLKVKKEAFLRLKQKSENFDPFKFIEYSEEIADETPQLQ
jgi:alkyl sulfatase BDS1-like metallo-beta-lactamase superfamily hydrolase